MLYVKKTFSYLSKSFWLLALVSLIPAILLGIFLRPLGFITFLPDYAATAVDAYGDIAELIFNTYALVYVYPIILIFVALALCCSLALSVIEKHFRTGKLMLKAPLADINSSLFPTLKTLAVLVGTYLLWKFLLSGLTTLFHFIFSGQGRPSALNLILSAVVIVALFLTMLFFGVPAVFWTPLMLTFGYSFGDAFIEAVKLAGKAHWKLFVALAFPFVAVALIQSALEFLTLHIILEKAISSVLYLFMLTYLLAFMMVAMFDLSGLERRDIKKKYI